VLAGARRVEFGASISRRLTGMVLALHNYPASRRPLQSQEWHSPTLETSPGDLVVEG